MRHVLMTAALLTGICSQAGAGLVAVNWAPKSTPDGLASGTLGSLGVNLISTDGAVNGGDTFSGNWPNEPGTSGVPGISALAGANRVGVDWNSGTPGFATVTFTGGAVTNPILLFDFTDPHETFDFGTAISPTILSQSPAGSVSLVGHVVTLNGTPGNSANDGFALQLPGTFTSFSFQTNESKIEAESVGFSIAENVSPTSSVPLPGGAWMGLIGLAAAALVGRRIGVTFSVRS